MSETITSVEALEKQLNEAILSGKALDAFEQLYAEDVVMQENSDTPFEGKAVNRQREIDFFSSVGELHDLKLLSYAVNGDVSLSEWLYDVTFKNGPRVKLAQTAVRRWKNGQVASERFYYSK